MIKDIQAVIFDMDGVIIDSNPYHKAAWNKFCSRYGFTLTEQDFEQMIYGRINDEVFKHLFGDEVTRIQMDAYTEEKEALYQEFQASNLKLIDGLLEFLDYLEANGVRKAIATSAPPTNINFIMKALDLRKFFPVIIDPTYITNGKPDPEIYLKAAEALYIAPDSCVVFEDSMSGIQAAKSAGMKVIGVTTTHSREELIDKVDLVVDNFKHSLLFD